ncbi:MAG: hypothetical protein ACR2HK_04225 [Gemmatimonadales bacterium]
MHRVIFTAAALVMVQACHDSTSPTIPPQDTSPEVQPLAVAAAARQVWAVVDLSGNSGVAKLGVGQYEVTFNRNVMPCAYVATTNNAYSQALGVYTAAGHLSANGVYVETKNQGGGLTDGPFNLVVACGPLSTRFA